MILLVVIWVCSVGGLGARIWDLDFERPIELFRSFDGMDYGGPNGRWLGLFNKNHSLIAAPDPSGCVWPSSFNANHSVVVYDSVVATVLCMRGTTFFHAQNANASAVIDLFPIQTVGWFVDNHYNLPIAIPAFYFRFIDFFELMPTSRALGEALFEIYFAATTKNLTIYLTPPQESAFHVQLRTPGSGVNFCYAINMIAAILCVLICSLKLQLLIIGLKEIHLSHIVLVVCICAGIIGIPLAMAGSQGRLQVGFPYLVYWFFVYWPGQFAFTASLLVGLFFAELTFISRTPIKLFRLMKWPSLALLGAIWICLLVGEAMSLAVLVSPTWLIVVLLFGFALPLFTVGAGTIMLSIHLWKIRHVSKSVKPVVLILVRTCIAVIVVFCFEAPCVLIFQNLFWLPYTLSESSVHLFLEYCFVLVPSFACILLSFNFSVGHQKEIDHSKAEVEQPAGVASPMLNTNSTTPSQKEESAVEAQFVDSRIEIH